jgi:polar amino acid transport system ATP-binding protein
MTKAIRIEGLRKSFGDHEVLKGIDLAVDDHEVVCLIGASGSGKSTLLRCIDLLETVDAGRIWIGQQQRVAIARALAMNPDVLLLDEVTSALDPVLVAEVLDTIRQLATVGMTMVIATHEMGFARDVARRVAFLEDGRILEEGPPDRIFSDPVEEATRRFLDRIIAAGRM